MDPLDPPEDIDSVDELLDVLQTVVTRQNQLAERVDDVETELGRIETMTLAADDRSAETRNRLEDVRDEVERLRDQVEMMDATMPAQQKNKYQKIRDIIEYGIEEATGGHAGKKVDTGEAAAAAGCSRDTARRLMDEIGNTFPWADVEVPGGPVPKELRLSTRNRDGADLLADVDAKFRGGS